MTCAMETISNLGELTSSIVQELERPLATMQEQGRAITAALDTDPPGADHLEMMIRRVMYEALAGNDTILRVRSMTVKREEFAAVSSQAALEDVVTAIAHELRQPLGAIVTNCEASLRWLARAEPNFDKVHQLSERIVESAVRASDIMASIGKVAAVSVIGREALDPGKVAAGAVRVILEGGQAARVNLILEAEPDCPLVEGDAILLQQVLMNLLMNSLHAMERCTPDPTIHIAVTHAAEGVMIRVRDNGPGFPAADLPRIFARFFTTKPSGFGIGLTLCRSIVEAHQGSIEAANAAEGGAVIEVALPAMPAA